jgi:hypothetical protein
MRLFAIGLLLIAVLTGCAPATTGIWSYIPEPRRATDSVTNASVVVLPFEDRRSDKNSNLWFFYFVPLMPFGWMTLHKPEDVRAHLNSGPWRFSPTVNFAFAVAQEIDNARIFREVFVGDRASGADYILFGEIASTKYEGKVISYGLSFSGVWLWFLGLPASMTANELTLTLKLAKTPSTPPLWTHTIRGESSAVSWAYRVQSDFTYDQLLKQGLREAVTSLAGSAGTLK